jgi:hypothetical protein
MGNVRLDPFEGNLMNTTNRISILIVTAQLCLQVCYAGDFYVNPGQSIQAAIDSASYGDTVHVAAGSYVENITHKNGVALIGADPSTTVIDGNQSGSVVTSPECDPNTLLTNFKITNGYSGTGGGLNTDYFSSPTVNNCIFADNSANYGGGGMYINVGCAAKISNSIFQSNSADDDGGAICYNGFSEFEGPYSIVDNCSFVNNTARRGGGLYNIDYSNPTVRNSTFYGNTAVFGGGICNDHSNPKIFNCMFIFNEAVDAGGGIINHESSPAINNCSFVGKSSSYGRSIDNYKSNFEIKNCIMWGDTSVNEIHNTLSTPEISNCNIAGCGGSGVGWDTSMGIDGGGNIDDDPLFLDPNGVDGIAGTTDDDLRLSSGSPCIDAGDNTAVTEPNDIDGLPRIVDGDCDGTATVDMGAHELDWLYAGDFEGGDCDVDLGDFAVMAQSWQLDNPAIDIMPYLDPDGIIDIQEMFILCEHWLDSN